MKFSFGWLKSFFDLKQNHQEVGYILTDCGLEVESCIPIRQDLSDFIVAQVLEAVSHPNSDRLKVCTVFDGKQNLQIVCGALNARKGIKVILAPVGSVIPNGGFKIEKSTIRGVESCGMLCSASELLLGLDSDGIVELPSFAIVGQRYVDFSGLNDYVFDISITPNRGDCASVFGIARDLSAKMGNKLEYNFHDYDKTVDQFKNCEVLSEFVHSFNLAKCSLSSFVENEKIDLFFAKTNKKSEIPVVNLTNFIMMNFGQPMHAYDFDKIVGKVLVRLSVEGEYFVPIVGSPIKLPSDILVVADDEKVLSVAGIMGDLRSAVLSSTTTVLLESGNFDKSIIRKAVRVLGLKSDSSYRFERGVDFELAKKALYESCFLFNLKPVEVYSFASFYEKKKIFFDFSSLKNLLGLEISRDEVVRILKCLHFDVVDNFVFVPFFRHDVDTEDDLCEEVLRIYGYNNLKREPLSYFSVRNHSNIDFLLESRDFFSSVARLDEVINFSFVREENLVSTSHKIKLKNPISEDFSFMRDSLFANLIEVVKKNYANGERSFSIFEIGRVFLDKTDEGQKYFASAVLAGLKRRKSFASVECFYDIFDIKKICVDFFGMCGIQEGSLSFVQEKLEIAHPNLCYKVLLGNKNLAKIFQVHPKNSPNLEFPIFVFEVDLHASLDFYLKKSSKKGVYTPFYLPNVVRDISVILDSDVNFDKIFAELKKLRLESLVSTRVLDVFCDDTKIGFGKKSVSLEFTFSQGAKVLTLEDIGGFLTKIANALAKNLGAVLRDGVLSL